MTRDEVRELIALAVRTCEFPIGGGFDATGHLTGRDSDAASEAVLAAFAARGLIIGEPVDMNGSSWPTDVVRTVRVVE